MKAGFRTRPGLESAALLVAMALGMTPPEAGAKVTTAGMANFSVRLARHRSAKNICGDDRRTTFNFEVHVKNNDFAKAYTGLRGKLYAYAERANQRGVYKMIKTECFRFDLPAKGKYAHACAPVTVKFDRRGTLKYGLKYKGYAVVVRDSKGNVVFADGSNKSFLRKLTAFERLHEGAYFDRKLSCQQVRRGIYE